MILLSDKYLMLLYSNMFIEYVKFNPEYVNVWIIMLFMGHFIVDVWYYDCKLILKSN